MLRSMIEELREEGLKFSVREIEKGTFLMAAAAVALFILAFVTFEGEYLSGYGIERLLEYAGFLKPNWMADHYDVFLHDIQMLFIVTFLTEVFLLISWYIKGWEL
ncbi:hypothetical protein [Paremcibacter congregatus]|nr:hypothetical protein [Paremcibacter congregatus]QDE27831.1 hypothetical protein FIV45_11385 [Paremcibacter congregatus]